MGKTALHPVFSIGHSTRSAEEFIAILRSHGVELVVDVRHIPKSRHNPQFFGTTLKHTLSAAGIAYRHFPELGGRRNPSPKTKNTAWRNRGFRGYADHMQTDVFLIGIHELLEAAKHCTLAIMCAEAVPWRCHRNLIADALYARGIIVRHILNESTEKDHEHRMTPFAKLRGKKITYPESRLSRL